MADKATERDKLNKDIDLCVELLELLRDTGMLHGSNNTENIASIKRTRILINDILRREYNSWQ